MLNFITGGVCAAQGFRAGGIHVGVKTHAAWKKDVALIVSDEDCACAAVYTKNAVKAAHIHVDKRHLADGKARAAVINSGNANACAPMGEENAERVCAAAGKALGCRPEDVVVAATGVIGQTLNVAVIEQGMPELCAAAAHTAAGSDAAAHAIMTTDTVKKELAVETVIGGKTVRMGGIAKGSGMIHPNMGTMLCFLTTDCAISSEMIKSALLETVQVSFNRISVDGDTSTNDTCCVLANGLAGNPVITEKGPDYDAFVEALRALCVELAKKMASDGEGATHLITCTVTGAGSEQSAETVAKSVIGSALGIWLILKFRRRQILIADVIGVGTCLLAIAAVFQFMIAPYMNAQQTPPAWAAYVILGLMAVFMLIVQSSNGTIVWTMMGEIFPNNVRGVMNGTAIFCLWVVNAIVGWTFPVMIEGLGGGLTYTVYGIINLVVAVVLYRIMPETSGKSLEEIEKEMEERFS